MSKLLFGLFVLVFGSLLFVTTTARAEILSGADWVGMFIATNSPSGGDAPILAKWANTCADASLVVPLADGTYNFPAGAGFNKAPAHNGSCVFANPATLTTPYNGLFEFRYMSNGKNFIHRDFNPANAPLSQAISGRVWVPTIIIGTPQVTCQGLTASIQVNWTNTVGITGFKIERAENAGFTLNLVTLSPSWPPGSTAYIDSGLALNKTYYYRITANGIDGTTQVANSNPFGSTPISCFAWVQTTGGDIHTNGAISTPTGP